MKGEKDVFSRAIYKDSTCVEGRSKLEVARYFGIHRKTVKKMCQYADPPGYRRKSEPLSPKLAPFTDIIDAIWKLTNKCMLSSATLRYGYWNDYAMSMALLVVIPSYVIMFTKQPSDRRKCLCRWCTCLVMPCTISLCKCSKFIS